MRVIGLKRVSPGSRARWTGEVGCAFLHQRTRIKVSTPTSVLSRAEWCKCRRGVTRADHVATRRGPSVSARLSRRERTSCVSPVGPAKDVQRRERSPRAVRQCRLSRRERTSCVSPIEPAKDVHPLVAMNQPGSWSAPDLSSRARRLSRLFMRFSELAIWLKAAHRI